MAGVTAGGCVATVTGAVPVVTVPVVATVVPVVTARGETAGVDVPVDAPVAGALVAEYVFRGTGVLVAAGELDPPQAASPIVSRKARGKSNVTRCDRCILVHLRVPIGAQDLRSFTCPGQLSYETTSTVVPTGAHPKR